MRRTPLADAFLQALANQLRVKSCVEMATVASTSRRHVISRPQPIVTRKRKRQEGDDDPVAALVSQGLGGVSHFHPGSLRQRAPARHVR